MASQPVGSLCAVCAFGTGTVTERAREVVAGAAIGVARGGTWETRIPMIVSMQAR
jgi:hypothetical protein